MADNNVELKATRVYYRNEVCKKKIVINRGGARSSKSYSIGQLILTKFLSEKDKKILIVRKTLPSLRISTMQMWKELLYNYGVGPYLREEKLLMNYYYNNNVVHFGSIDDPEKIKSTEWNYIWMEEATEFKFEDFTQLNLRLSAKTHDGNRNQLFISFNPVDEFHWIKEKILDSGAYDCEEIHSTYKDNPYLDADYIQTLEDLINQDINFHRIYALGEWGKLDNLIYPGGWKVVDDLDEGFDFYGLDFGFNVPSALVKISIAEKGLQVQQKLYQSGLTNTDLIDRCKKLIPNKNHAIIYADAAEPDRILEFKKAGFKRIKAAHKSVEDGIDFVKSQKLFIDRTSEDLIKEMRSYSWKTDKHGNVLDEPVKFMDHALDAMRYAIFTHLCKGKNSKLRWL